MFFRCLLGGWNRAKACYQFQGDIISIYISLSWIGGYQWRNSYQGTRHDYLYTAANLARASQSEYLTQQVITWRDRFHHINWINQNDAYGKTVMLLIQLLRCNTRVCGVPGSSFFDQTMPPLTQPMISTLHGTPGSGLACGIRKCSHGKWELKLFPSGSICTVGK